MNYFPESCLGNPSNDKNLAALQLPRPWGTRRTTWEKGGERLGRRELADYLADLTSRCALVWWTPQGRH
jgi:hypothetical protein